jgi:YVTN family beta-propeller protein
MVFVLNRFGQDNLQILDPSAGFATVGQFSTGNGTNPHDIAFVSPEKAYITLYGSDRILMMNPLTGEILGEIDLSSFADADGTPEVDALHLIGSSLFASVQRLDRNNFFAPLGSSIVLVIDTVTDMVIRQIPVEVNPFTDFVELPDGNLLLGSPGEFGVLEDGGINLIDTGSHTNTVVISDAALGGDVTDIVMIDDSKGYAIVTDESFNTHVVSFDLDTRSKLRTVMEAEGFSIVDLAVNSAKEVYVSYRKRDNPGIRIIDGLTDQEITAAPIDVGLPPNQTLFLE